MIDRVAPLTLLRAAVLPAACIGVAAYFAFHAVSGSTGLVAWRGYEAQHAAVAAKAATVAAEKAALARQVALLDRRHVDRDYADELVRGGLGVLRPDEVIVPLPDAK